MKKIMIVLLILVVMFCSGCAGQGEAIQVKVLLDWVPNTNHTGLYVANRLGYYESEGLDVSIIQPPEGGGASLVAAGQAHFGIGYQEDIAYARATDNPLPIKAVAAIIQNNTSGFASLKSSGIKSPKDFENKVYGGWGSPMEEAMVREVVEKAGGDFTKVQMVNMGTTDFFQALQKEIDFAWIYYGWDGVASEMMDLDLEFIPINQLDPVFNFYTPVIYISDDLAKKNPGLIKDFLKATSRGYEYCIENPEEAARILTEEVKELDHDLVLKSQIYLGKEYMKGSDRWGVMKEEIWENYTRWMFDNQLIDRIPETKEAFTNEYLP